jgi:hypothetical protein
MGEKTTDDGPFAMLRAGEGSIVGRLLLPRKIPLMTGITLTPIAIGDRVRMRKPHPCGGFEWTISRVGADIGLKCATCGRRALLTRRDFEKRLREVVSRVQTADANAEQAAHDSQENDSAPTS